MELLKIIDSSMNPQTSFCIISITTQQTGYFACFPSIFSFMKGALEYFEYFSNNILEYIYIITVSEIELLHSNEANLLFFSSRIWLLGNSLLSWIYAL